MPQVEALSARLKVSIMFQSLSHDFKSCHLVLQAVRSLLPAVFQSLSRDFWLCHIPSLNCWERLTSAGIRGSVNSGFAVLFRTNVSLQIIYYS
jgi:hypothetical protein